MLSVPWYTPSAWLAPTLSVPPRRNAAKPVSEMNSHRPSVPTTLLLLFPLPLPPLQLAPLPLPVQTERSCTLIVKLVMVIVAPPGPVSVMTPLLSWRMRTIHFLRARIENRAAWHGPVRTITPPVVGQEGEAVAA